MARQAFQFETYHENSKLRAGDIDLYTWIGFVNSDPSIRRVISAPVLEYGGMDEIMLPPLDADTSAPLFEVLARRRSERNFGEGSCKLETFSALIGHSIKENVSVDYEDGVHWNFRPYPSGGALYPVDVYVFANQVDAIPRGIYSYNPNRHSLTEISNSETDAFNRAMPTLEQELDRCAFVVLLVTDLAKMSFKYQERAYRFALLECGHMAQNLLLSASSLKLKAFPVGAFMDDAMNRILNLDGVSSNVQYVLMFGT